MSHDPAAAQAVPSWPPARTSPLRPVCAEALRRGSQGLVLALLAAMAQACPPPPPPVPTVQQQAARFLADAEALCLMRLREGTQAPSALPELRRWALADGYWQAEATALKTLKGACAGGTVYFAEVSPALCGGGLPPYDVDLVVAMTREGVLARWTLAQSELGAALRQAASSSDSAGARRTPRP